MSDLVSRVYQPDPKMCCEACVFGAGKHAAFCPVPAEEAFLRFVATRTDEEDAEFEAAVAREAEALKTAERLTCG